VSGLTARTNCLGFELHDGDSLVTLYRANEVIAREESPKPCFHPIHTPSGKLVTEYRPKDHLWHTGLYYGWVHVNTANLWGGPWYLKEIGKYESYPGTHGRQAHEWFDDLKTGEEAVRVTETLTWRDGEDAVMANEKRRLQFRKLDDPAGTIWHITSVISPETDTLTLGASRAARYSGLELRMGPPFAPATHRTSEGTQGHENIMRTKARWCCAVGEGGGAVVMLDHPSNPRHPTNWFTRAALMGAGLLMDEDLIVRKGDSLTLKYLFMVLDEDPDDAFIEAQFEEFAARD